MAVSKQFLESIMETIRVYWSDSEAESDQESPELSDSEGEGDQSGPGSSGGPQSGPGSSERDQGPPTEVHEFQVSKSQCSALKQLLEETVQKPSFKETISRALFKVCERGLHNVAEVLLRFNADVNYTASSGCTPLHVAVKKGDTETVKLLVRNGASLEEEEDCECEMSPLFLACLNKDLECVRTLLYLGADIYDEDFEGTLCVHSVVSADEQRGSSRLSVERLDCSIKDNSQQTNCIIKSVSHTPAGC